MVHAIVENLPISSNRLQELKSSTQTECELQTVMKMIKEGWPTHKKQVPPAIRNFWDIRNDLHEAEGIIMKSQKLVIPLSMRQYILELLHKAHLRTEKTKSRARATVYCRLRSAAATISTNLFLALRMTPNRANAISEYGQML